MSKFSLALLLCLFACLVQAVDSSADPKPNILIYLADDLGYGSINSYGAPEDLLKTPHLNQLALDGVQFDNAYTPASVCTPTRYSMLTGEYPWRSRLKKGVISKTDYTLVDWNRVSLAKWLQGQGYATAHVGKWHLGYKTKGPVLNLLGDLSEGGPMGLGFDYHFGVPSNLEDIHKVYIENGSVWGLRSDKLTPWGNNWYAKRKGNVGPYLGYDAPQRITENVMTMTTDKAVDWLEKQSSAKPFFLYYAAVAVHNPIEPAPELRGSSNCGLYGDFLQEVDHTFGRMVQTLEKKGILENTLIIFASDNGGEGYASGMPHNVAEDAGLLINGPLRGKKGNIWEGGFKTPLIISHPRGAVPAGMRSDARVSVVDFYATLADYVAGPGALEQLDAPDSISFKRELVNPGAASFERPPLVLSDRLGRKALHFENWKYIQATTAPNKQPALLFDLSADPMELHNLLGERPEVAARGSELLAEIVAGDDVIEWDGGGGGYRHAAAYRPRSGRFHLELKAITGVSAHPYCYAFKDVPVQSGAAVDVSIHASLTEAPGGGRASAQLKLTFLDVKGDKLQTHESEKLTVIASGYELLTIRATAPSTAVTLRMTPVVRLQGERGTVAAYFDDARLTTGETVYETSFESGAIR
ncbi:MAG: arylsulfatase [Coraliomargarita sp.]|nr:arylsulfatase [Coraliomargarita sp.]